MIHWLLRRSVCHHHPDWLPLWGSVDGVHWYSRVYIAIIVTLLIILAIPSSSLLTGMQPSPVSSYAMIGRDWI